MYGKKLFLTDYVKMKLNLYLGCQKYAGNAIRTNAVKYDFDKSLDNFKKGGI